MSLLQPHRWIEPRDAREEFLVGLLDTLWAGYRARMKHVRTYEELVLSRGARFLNDHVAFRTLAVGGRGIADVSRPFEALGYVPAACYEFPDKNLSAVHFRPPRPEFPKLFVSQLKVWELPPMVRRIILRSVKGWRPPLADDVLAGLREGKKSLMKPLLRHFQALPWGLPQKKDVLALDKESQFGAWVLLNGFNVNHFTASVDSHGVDALDDIEKVQAALSAAGVPMKKEIEGKRGDRLRQTATEAVVTPVKAREGKRIVEMPWTYAYFEIAQRPLIDGRRFEGFLGAQATNLFEMTKVPQ